MITIASLLGEKVSVSEMLNTMGGMIVEGLLNRDDAEMLLYLLFSEKKENAAIVALLDAAIGLVKAQVKDYDDGL